MGNVYMLADLRARREEILELAAKYGAYDVRIFGSIARGDSTPASDVDLLVRFTDGASLFELSGFRQDLKELLGIHVDVIEDHPGLRERFRQHVMEDAVPL